MLRRNYFLFVKLTLEEELELERLAAETWLTRSEFARRRIFAERYADAASLQEARDGARRGYRRIEPRWRGRKVNTALKCSASSVVPPIDSHIEP